VELRGLEPLTFSLRMLRLAEDCAPWVGESRCIGCILILGVMLRGTHGAPRI